MKKIGKTLLAGAAIVGFALALDFVALNWVTGCETWDREQWTEQNSCVAPSDIWDSIVGKAHAGERSVREVRRDYEQRISPSWEERLRYSDRKREREEREDERKRERDWRRLTTTPEEREEREEECDE